MPYYNTSQETNKEKVLEKGKEWFETIRKKVRLEPRYNLFYIVIDVDSGEHFLDQLEKNALAKAVEKLGEKNFFIHRCQFF